MCCKHDERNDMTHLRLHIATSEMGGDAPTERTRITYQLSQFSDSYPKKKKKKEKGGISSSVSAMRIVVSLTDPFFKFFKVGLLGMKVRGIFRVPFVDERRER
jgi:hypothetical protein